jgi:hypothetical protein
MLSVILTHSVFESAQHSHAQGVTDAGGTVLRALNSIPKQSLRVLLQHTFHLRYKGPRKMGSNFDLKKTLIGVFSKATVYEFHLHCKGPRKMGSNLIGIGQNISVDSAKGRSVVSAGMK